jgi:heme/copper-type cytochrome/quinol oxidase subunit 3
MPPPRPPTGGGDGPDGEPTPRRALLDNAVLATLFLIGAEVMFFGGLVSAFWVLRLAAPVWPPPLQPRLPLGVTAANTLVLLTSSIAVAAAGRALGAGRRRAAVRRLGAAAALGVLFLAVQGYEWMRLIQFGVTVGSGPYGATFYTLIGAHAAHVAGAVGWLTTVLALLGRGRLGGRRLAAVRACTMYWHFVVALWPILWASVYLL